MTGGGRERRRGEGKRGRGEEGERRGGRGGEGEGRRGDSGYRRISVEVEVEGGRREKGREQGELEGEGMKVLRQYTELVKDPCSKYLHTLTIVTTEGELVSLISQSRQLLSVREVLCRDQPGCGVALLSELAAREGCQHLFSADVRLNVDHPIDALIFRAGCTT